MGSQDIVAIWDFYDSGSGRLLEAGRKATGLPVPTMGQLIVGVPGKPNSIVRDFKLNGIKDRLPWYSVYV